MPVDPVLGIVVTAHPEWSNFVKLSCPHNRFILVAVIAMMMAATSPASADCPCVTQASGFAGGGGEYGKDWHESGMKLVKQNVFDDFISAAEWLIDNNYTRPAKLAIEGRSNGGLLVGACMIQRPDLFGCCLPGVGVMDMLRFHKFTIGWAWTSDYGSSENADEFAALYAYSPYHNLKPGTSYPPTLVTTADHDDRVVPGHSFKFAAALQAAHVGEAPTLIRIQTKSGHGAGKPTSMRIEEAADLLAFMVKSLDVDAH